MNKTNSIHRSTLQLTANALQGIPMRKTQPVIRTIKFRIAKPEPDANNKVHLPEKERIVLDRLFNAFESWREKKILKELNEEFELDRAKFLAESAKRNQGYYNTRFVKGKKENVLARALRTCYAFSLPQEIKSFRTRYENVVKELRKTYRKNLKDWQEKMLPLFTENGEIPPPAPTQIDFGPDDKSVTVTKDQLDAHNNWVFIAKQRSWKFYVLVIVSRKRSWLCQPDSKGFPVFPAAHVTRFRLNQVKLLKLLRRSPNDTQNRFQVSTDSQKSNGKHCWITTTHRTRHQLPKMKIYMNDCTGKLASGCER